MVIAHFVGMRCPSVYTLYPVSLRVQSLRSIKELEYSLTLRTLYTNAANIVAINCYQFVWLLPARVVSAIITNYGNHLLLIFLSLLDA